MAYTRDLDFKVSDSLIIRVQESTELRTLFGLQTIKKENNK